MVFNKIIAGIVTGTCFGLLAILLSWLLGGETSPFHEYFSRNVSLKNLWMMLNFPAYMGLIVIGVTSFAAGILFVFIQWFIIGFVASFSLYGRLKKKFH